MTESDFAHQAVSPKRSAQALRLNRFQGVVHGVAVVLLGIVFPIILLVQAYDGLRTLRQFVVADVSATPEARFATIKPRLANANDYGLFSLLSAEHANETMMTNKQIMKISTIQVGFSVISLGLMLVILGINDGGVNGAGEIESVKFNFKTGSTGVVIFLAGAGMAAAGGLLRNDYKTVPIPTYVYTTSQDRIALAYYQQCKVDHPAQLQACFLEKFEHSIAKEAP